MLCFMTVCIYRYIHTTTLYYWPNTTGMSHLKIILHLFQGRVEISRSGGNT